VPCLAADRAETLQNRLIPSASLLNLMRPMPRPSTQFACTDCGHVAATWMGRCPGCGEWNTLVEEPATQDRRPRSGSGGPSGRDLQRTAPLTPVALSEVASLDVERLSTGSDEFDRVLGGGIVPGSIILIGGSPGIGKSTLMSSTLASLERSGHGTIYVSAEESAAQVRLRAERLGEAALSVPVIAETSLEAVLATLEAERPSVCVIDSVQTIHAAYLSGAPGSVGQVREVAARLERLARERQIAVILVGHVTKDGALAGPRVLEHAVDCVLQFEGEHQRTYRVLRVLKNRFGPTNDVGVFEMRSGGLTEVSDPSARFLREASPVPGSCMLCAMEGSRPLLVEVQALVAPTDVVPPRRIANGIDRNRLSLVLAVLSRHSSRRALGDLPLGGADVFVNLAGGVRVEEPGADLAVALAVASAASGIPPGGDSQPVGCFGEVGLTGELRYVAHADRRLEEAARFGLERVVTPAACLDSNDGEPGGAIGAATLADAIEIALSLDTQDVRAA
jgi:DNA repair protein RadA/Sms